MSSALVTGAPSRITAVATALRTEGFDTTALDHWNPDVDVDAGGRMGRASLDCYVQLPVESAPPVGAPGGGGAIGPQSLAARVEAVTAVMPLLTKDAAVLLVADDAGWDWRRRDALQLLAEAAVADHDSSSVRVAVLGEPASPVDIAATARRESAPASTMSLADVDPGLGYGDWRNEVLSFAGGMERTYFGWTALDGRPRAAILRGSVVSPLPGAVPGEMLAWGRRHPGALVLAGAVLADALGADTRCRRCRGEGGACRACGGSGLEDWVGHLAGVFAEEVLGSFPAAGFELRVGDVVRWVEGRRPRVSPAAPAAGTGTGPAGGRAVPAPPAGRHPHAVPSPSR